MPAELTLAHDRAGRGEPLVLVHPLGADRAVWEPVMGLLSPCHDTIAVDMPGFGGSPETGPDDPPTPARTARAIVSTLDELGIEHAHVAGISLGGWAALEFGTTGRCLSVTGLCTAGFWNRPLGPRPEVARSAALGLVRLARPLLSARRVRNLALRGVVRHPERVS